MRRLAVRYTPASFATGASSSPYSTRAATGSTPEACSTTSGRDSLAADPAMSFTIVPRTPAAIARHIAPVSGVALWGNPDEIIRVVISAGLPTFDSDAL